MCVIYYSISSSQIHNLPNYHAPNSPNHILFLNSVLCIFLFFSFSIFISQKISKGLRKELEAAYSDMNSKFQKNEQVEVEEGEAVVGKRRSNRFFKDEEKGTSTSISNRNNGKNHIRDLDRNRNKFVSTDDLQFRSTENSKIEDDLRDFYGSDNNLRNSGSMKLPNKVNNNTTNTDYDSNSNNYNSSTGINPLRSFGNNNTNNSNKSRSRNRNSQISMETEEVAESQLLELNHEIGNFSSHRICMSVSLSS